MSLLTVSEAAERLRISAKTIYKLVDEGRLGCVRPSPSGRSIRIPEEELAAFVEASRVRRPYSRHAAGLRHIKMPAAG